MAQKFLINRINISTVKQLMLDRTYISLPELKISEFDDADYLLLKNGNLLVTYLKDNFGILYNSVEELKRYDNYVKGNTRHEALKKLPSLDVFFSLRDKYANLLSAKFLFEEVQLDFSFESLKILDSKLHLIIDFDEFINQFYIPFTNYIGNVIIKEKNGSWIKTFNNEFNLYEPEIELPSKKNIPIGFDLYNEASENFSDFTLMSVAIMRLDSL